MEEITRAYHVFNVSEEGRIILQDLQDEFKVLSPTYDGDIYQAMINEGKRQAFLYIQDQAEEARKRYA